MPVSNVVAAFILLVAAPGRAAPASHRSLVVGGVVPTPFSLPWTLALFKMGSHSCGATLVHPRWAVTAAHCLNGAVAPGIFAVGVYRHNLITPNEHPCSELIAVKSVHRHPLYNPSSVANDIGLIELMTPAACADPSNPNYDPRMLALLDGVSAPSVLSPGPTADANYLGVDALISGWGATTPLSQVYPLVLRAATLPVVQPDTCQHLVGTKEQIEVRHVLRLP